MREARADQPRHRRREALGERPCLAVAKPMYESRFMGQLGTIYQSPTGPVEKPVASFSTKVVADASVSHQGHSPRTFDMRPPAQGCPKASIKHREHMRKCMSMPTWFCSLNYVQPKTPCNILQPQKGRKRPLRLIRSPHPHGPAESATDKTYKTGPSRRWAPFNAKTNDLQTPSVPFGVPAAGMC